jgi:hypothetical protein
MFRATPAFACLLASVLLGGCALPPEGAPRSLAATADAYGYERAGFATAAAPSSRGVAGSAPRHAAPSVPVAMPQTRIVAAGAPKENAFHAPAVVVGVTRSGGYVSGGRTLTAAQLPEVFAAAARKDPATVAIIRPAQGAPQWAVQRAADLGNAAGLHCLPFPAR